MRKQSPTVVWTLLSATLFNLVAATAGQPVSAAQSDVPGPQGSVVFGTKVMWLPNGNFVVTDPGALPNGRGAVYLYGASGQLISALTGGSDNDQVGSGGVVRVGSDFVVLSPQWKNGAATSAGAATWVNGTIGRSGTVSASNSLVGTTTNDRVGLGGAVALGNGNYVVVSYAWSNGAATIAGAVTWGNGNGSTVGPISSANSLVGTHSDDRVGNMGVTVLSNGNYVVPSAYWDNGAIVDAGAVTWANGNVGIAGVVSATNSLVGTVAWDVIGSGGVVALTNGHFAVSSPAWHNGNVIRAGAVTWGNGNAALVGTVTAGNSLVGTVAESLVGYPMVIPLTNGNYVVVSREWNSDVATSVGAITWRNGSAAMPGVVSSVNSLVGSADYDRVGLGGVTALTNGNYVVASPAWRNGSSAAAGAATWGSGAGGVSGPVSASNSLVGSVTNDQVGEGVTALRHGHYVVSSPHWNNGALTQVGAVTWGNGDQGISGTVSSGNSLTGSTKDDLIGYPTIAALSDGNYVVGSGYWDDAGVQNAGAVTWANGNGATSGFVTDSNSLVGQVENTWLGMHGVTALNNGAYVIKIGAWLPGTTSSSVLWASPRGGTVGAVAPTEAFLGGDHLAPIAEVTVFSDGNYVIKNRASWSTAVTLANEQFRLKGAVQFWNSIIGSTNSIDNVVYDYDVVRHQLLVGHPTDNTVSVFVMDQIYAAGMEQ